MPLGLYKLMQHTSFREKVTKRWFKTIPNVPANLNNCKTFIILDMFPKIFMI